MEHIVNLIHSKLDKSGVAYQVIVLRSGKENNGNTNSGKSGI